MKRKKYDDFELLLHVAAEECVEQSARDYRAIDASGVPVSPRALSRLRRLMHRRARVRRGRIVLVACLAVIAMGLTACAAIPQLRAAVKSMFLTMHDKYVSVNVGDAPEETTEPPRPTTPPTTIEKKASPTWLPGEFRRKITVDHASMFEAEYYNTDGDLVFVLSQLLFKEDILQVNSEDATVREFTMDGKQAYLMSYAEEPNVYNLLWTDNLYIYHIYGYFESVDDLIQIAESVEV